MLLCVGGEEKQPMYGPDHQEEALCQWFTRVGGGAWNHSSLPTSHNNRDELSSQKPLLLLIKALYIVCFVFFLFLLLVLIKYRCCFYIVFQLGFIIMFMQVSSPAVLFVFWVVFFLFFSPTDFLCKTEIQLFLYFYFLW